MDERIRHHKSGFIHKDRALSNKAFEFEPKVSSKNIEIAGLILASGSFLYYRDKPFELNSNILSPIYINNRLILSKPEARTLIVESIIDELKVIGIPDVVAGVATGGIPYAAIVAEKLGLPMAYAHPEPKTHGTQNQVGGEIKDGQNVVVIEDSISSAGSSKKAIDALREEGAYIKDEIGIFTRGMKVAEETLKKSKVNLFTLTDLKSVLEVAIETGYLNEEQVNVINEWSKDPKNWSKP